jgi:hypothetical protein
MTKHCFLIATMSATLFLTVASISVHAEGLGGLGHAVGGALGSLGNAVGNTVNGVTGNKSEITAILGSDGELSLEARSQMLNGIEAKAQVLSPKRLAKLCLSVGGGAGCESGRRSQILGIIDNRLDVLSDKRLASLCLSTGADGCGDGGSSGAGGANSIAAVPENAIAAVANAAVPADANYAVPENALARVPANANSAAPANASDRSRRLTAIAANLSSHEVIVYKKRCGSVLRNPQRYEDDIVQICNLIN